MTRSKAYVLQRLIVTKAELYKRITQVNKKRAYAWRFSVAFLSVGLLASMVHHVDCLT